MVAAPPEGVKALPIEKVVHELPETLIDLALWLAEYYGSTPARALGLVAPVRRAKRDRSRHRPESASRWKEKRLPSG